MFKQRINKLRKILKEKKLDGLLVTNFYNIFYLTGFKGLTETEREAFVIITTNKVYLITDKRYIENPNSKYQISNKFQIPNIKILLIAQQKKLIQYLQEVIKNENIKNLGFEGEDLKFIEYKGLKEKLEKVELIPTSRLISKLREIKETEEILKIKKACEIGDRCLKQILKTIKIGVSEKEITWKMERWLKEKRYDFSFYPIVAIDKNSAVPHYDTKNGLNNKIKKGSVVLIDFGVKYQNYCSDISRVFFFDKPKQEAVNIYNKLLFVQKKTLDYLATPRSWNSLKEIDEYCRQQLTNHLSPITNNHTYPHSTGHGVGLEIHEYPKLSITSQDVLKPNQVFTVEPGVYIEGKWGMRIEDTLVINSEYKVEVLTKFSKKPIII